MSYAACINDICNALCFMDTYDIPLISDSLITSVDVFMYILIKQFLQFCVPFQCLYNVHKGSRAYMIH